MTRHEVTPDGLPVKSLVKVRLTECDPNIDIFQSNNLSCKKCFQTYVLFHYLQWTTDFSSTHLVTYKYFLLSIYPQLSFLIFCFQFLHGYVCGETQRISHVLWSWRAGAELLHLILVWPCSTHTHIGGLFYTISGSVRSTAGISPRANPIPSVHR